MTPGNSNRPAARIAVDIGGTFTDVVLELPDGRQVTTKILTTYDHPGRAVLGGIDRVLQQAGITPHDVGLIIHGTTLATNALIERRGAVTALLTTEGHRDALEMAHEDRFEQYDIMIDRPRPLVPRHLRVPVRERMDRDGRPLVPLDETSVRAALAVLDKHEVESLAIGYLHAYVNAEHEQRTAEIVAAERPGLSITLASEVCPEIREFERLSTACANAYVRPLMSRYLERLGSELKQRGLGCPFLLMTSGGGLTTLKTAAKFPIRLVESGPAGGAILAQHVARNAGISRMLSFDMGGTTAKLCLLDDGEPLISRSFEVDRVYRFKKGSGLPVRIPVIEMVEIGAGGGSIAEVDKLGRIRVGPESAGSEPGPACYGRGGRLPTVTDADVLLGRIMADRFAGGAFQLDRAAAESAIAGGLAGQLDESDNAGDEVADVDAAAFGISEVVDENMAAAARAHAAEFGLDLAHRDMVAFGGAAPLHAARLGEKLGVQRIIIPPAAGVGSAVGFLLAPVAFEVVRSHRQLVHELDVQAANGLVKELHAEALEVVRQGAPDADLRETRHAYMRYLGQGHEIAVELPLGVYQENSGQQFQHAFETAYQKLYGRIIEGVPIEILSWTLTLEAKKRSVEKGSGPGSPVESPAGLATRDKGAQDTGADPTLVQELFDPVLLRRVEARVYRRDDLAAGTEFNGPALIVEDQTTTVVTSSYTAQVSENGSIVMDRKQNRDGSHLPADSPSGAALAKPGSLTLQIAWSRLLGCS